MGFSGIRDRTRYRGNSRFVKNQLDIFKRTICRFAIVQVRMDKVDISAQFLNIFTMTGREIVNHSYARTELKKAIRNMRADESGTAGDQNYPGETHKLVCVPD